MYRQAHRADSCNGVNAQVVGAACDGGKGDTRVGDVGGGGEDWTAGDGGGGKGGGGDSIRAVTVTAIGTLQHGLLVTYVECVVRAARSAFNVPAHPTAVARFVRSASSAERS